MPLVHARALLSNDTVLRKSRSRSRACFRFQGPVYMEVGGPQVGEVTRLSI